MDLGLSESQQMLRAAAREFLEHECPSSYVRAMEGNPRGYTFEVWDKVAALGWTGLPLEERYGGLGGSFLDLGVLLEEMGRTLFPGPFVSTVVVGGLSIQDAGTEEQRRAFLPHVASGGLLLALAVTEAAGTYEPWDVQCQALVEGDLLVLNGTKVFVPDAHVADYLLVAARTHHGPDPAEGVSVVLVPARTRGVGVTLLPSIGGDKLCEVRLTDVRVPRTAVLGELHRGWPVVERALERAAAAAALQMAGGAQAVLELTTEYLKHRVQFGRPVGAFQAMQHHAANMATDVEGCRLLAYQAAWKLATGEPAGREVAMAKAWASVAYNRVCALAQQAHGAIGFTREHNLQLFTRRARAAEPLFGGRLLAQEHVARHLGL